MTTTEKSNTSFLSVSSRYMVSCGHTMQDFLAKIKGQFLTVITPEVYTVLIIVLVGFGSFGLGRLSAREEEKTPIRILPPQGNNASSSDALSASAALAGEGSAQPKTSAAPRPSSGGLIVASKNGSKYYFPWCAGARRIGEANKTWFSSEQEAQTAGLTLAAGCRGNK